MKFLLGLPVVRTLHQRQLLFPVLVLIIVAAVLLEGTLERSRPAQANEGESFNEPVPRAIIRAGLDKTPLVYVSDYWNQLAEGARPKLTAIGSSGTPAILVGPGLALTILEPALEVVAARDRARLTLVDPEPVSEQPEDPVEDTATEVGSDPEDVVAPGAPDGSVVGEGDVPGRAPSEESGPHRLRSWDDEIGLALFDVDTQNDTAFTLSDPRILPSGSQLAAVTLDTNGRSTITPGYLVTAHSGPNGGKLVVSMDFPATLSIAAVVNLDGALVGVAYGTPDGPRVVTSTEMLGLLEALQTETRCRGVSVSDLSADVRSLIDVEVGVLVELVDTAAFEPQASLRGGDILIEWGGKPIDSAEQFMEFYDGQEPGSLVSYRAVRDRRRVTGGVVMHATDCRPLGPEPVRLPRFGLAVQWMPEQDEPTATAGWMVVAVAIDGTSATAGVDEHDWLVALDGQKLDRERDRSLLEAAAASDDALLLSLLRDGRAKLVAVLPPPQAEESDVGSAEVESAPGAGDR